MTNSKRTSWIDLSGTEPASNHSDNTHFQDILRTRMDRRHFVQQGAMLGSAGALLSFIGGCAQKGKQQAASPSSLLGFDAVPVAALDRVTLPAGYVAQVLLPWGTPLHSNGPELTEDASSLAAHQAEQIGSHHDGMHFFPINFQDSNPVSDEGLLVINHEYVDPSLLHPQGATAPPRPWAEVDKELAAHGVSVVHIRRDAQHQWHTVNDSRYHRRITGSTPMAIVGPLRGHDSMRTQYSPNGTDGRGTLNNCAMGVTPWGTYLTCEENWANSFINTDTPLPRSHHRYGIRADRSKYHWHSATPANDNSRRFDASTYGTSSDQDYRNEPHQFGWIVEIDPFDPQSTPKKHTALGRFAHEGIVFHPAVEGEPLVAYSGDDARFEYLYKYVSHASYHQATAGSHLLEEGTLYVAVFHDDGRGEWRALDIHDDDFQQRAKARQVVFADQADVLLNTRLAADVMGATKMDRPEWGAIHPHTGDVYFTLTNNQQRTEEQTDAANPRANNQHGHIIRWHEQGNPSSRHFRWDIFWFGGPTGTAQTTHNLNTDRDSAVSCPDGLGFDADGRLWIQTDISQSSPILGSEEFGHNAMFAADPNSGDVRRFLTGPIGCEITGVVSTPDQTTLFINIQHPGEGSSPDHFTSHWPFGQQRRPRSATLAIRRIDGGKVGA